MDVAVGNPTTEEDVGSGMAPEKAAANIEEYLTPAKEDGGPRTRRLTCISSLRIPEVDSLTGSWPEPHASRVFEFERHRSKFEKLFADAIPCAKCGGEQCTLVERADSVTLYHVTCCFKVKVFDLR
jgi:hypothetical protein